MTRTNERREISAETYFKAWDDFGVDRFEKIKDGDRLIVAGRWYRVEFDEGDPVLRCVGPCLSGGKIAASTVEDVSLHLMESHPEYLDELLISLVEITDDYDVRLGAFILPEDLARPASRIVGHSIDPELMTVLDATVRIRTRFEADPRGEANIAETTVEALDERISETLAETLRLIRTTDIFGNPTEGR